MQNLFVPYATKTYRADIQGVRAIGALLIMVYHIWLNRVSGGVDVFFVVSGFFMTTVLLNQVATQARIQPLVFWRKIITRIAPSAYIVLLVTIVLAYFFVPPTQWARLMDEAVASAFHQLNIYLMEASVDYLSRLEPPSAVQQFWALSVQMQFYLLLPFALMIATAVAKAVGRLYPLTLMVCAGIALSFLYSLYVTSHSPSSAYFNPLARAWEFGTGVLLAVLMPHWSIPTSLRRLMGLVGLALLLLCGQVVPESLPYPGVAALAPVTAASLLMLAGASGTPTAASRWLAHPQLTRLGDLAFAIYLWHWPLLVFYLQTTGRQTASIPAGLLIIALALTLAVATQRFIERPFAQEQKRQDFRVVYVSVILFFLPAATVASAIKLHFDTVAETRNLTFANAVKRSRIEPQLDATTMPYDEFIAAKAQRPASYTDECHQHTAAPEVKVCAYGDPDASVSIALVGGSHATQWLPALDTIGRNLGLKVLNITKSYCPLGALATSHASCVEWNKRVLQYLARVQPWLIVTNATRAATNLHPETVPRSYVDQWRKLAALHIPVVAIRDNPQFDFDVAHCVARSPATPMRCSKPRSAALSAVNPAQLLGTELDNLKLVDMTDLLCTEETCTPVFDDKLIYRDDEHLSVSYVDFLTPVLHARLARVAPEIFDRPSNSAVVSMQTETLASDPQRR